MAAVEDFGVARYEQLLSEMAPDVVFANESESRLLPTNLGGVAIVKHGPRLVDVRGSREEFTVDVPPLPAIGDTTGAGDAFAAGFLAATLGGVEMRDAVAAGIASAAKALQRH